MLSRFIHFAVIFQTREKGCHSFAVVWFSLVVSFSFFRFLSLSSSHYLLHHTLRFFWGKIFPLFCFRFFSNFWLLNFTLPFVFNWAFYSTFVFNSIFSHFFAPNNCRILSPHFSIRAFLSFPFLNDLEKKKKREVIFPPSRLLFTFYSFLWLKLNDFFKERSFFVKKKILTNCWE